MQKLIVLVAGLAILARLSTAAHAREVEYVSQHPVPHKFGGGFCHIGVPHVHNYEPSDRRLYREANGEVYFVGDPAPFGYEGPRYSYYGAHPVAEAEIHFGHPVYCYIRGPHYHWYQPPPQAQFQLSGGAYWYIGTYPPSYYDERPRYAVINEAYVPIPYARPMVDVQAAPVSVRAEISLGGPGWRATAVVGGPPAPVIYAPPPPPPPVQIGVGINLGGPPVGVEHREIIDRRRHHHDHGRHEGWREGPHFPKHLPRHEPSRDQPPRYAGPPRPFVPPPGIAHREPPRRGPGPNAAPTPARGLVPGHTRGPAPPPAQKHDDHNQNRHP